MGVNKLNKNKHDPEFSTRPDPTRGSTRAGDNSAWKRARTASSHRPTRLDSTRRLSIVESSRVGRCELSISDAEVCAELMAMQARLSVCVWCGVVQACDERFLQCPAAVTVAHLKKYIKLKFALDQQFAVSHRTS